MDRPRFTITQGLWFCKTICYQTKSKISEFLLNICLFSMKDTLILVCGLLWRLSKLSRWIMGVVWCHIFGFIIETWACQLYVLMLIIAWYYLVLKTLKFMNNQGFHFPKLDCLAVAQMLESEAWLNWEGIPDLTSQMGPPIIV